MLEKKSAKDYLEEGNKNSDIGNYKKAIENYDEAIKLNPKYKEAYSNRGVLYDILEEYQKAIEDFNKAIEIAPKYKEAYCNRGGLYTKLKKYTEAIEDFNKAIDIDPNFKEAYFNRGILYDDLKKYEKGIEDFNKAIEIDSKYKEAYCNRGSIYIKLKSYEKAIEDFNKAIEIDPYFKEVYYNRGNILIKLKKYEKAIEDFNKVIEIDPKYKEAYYHRGNIYIKLKKYEKAVEDFNKAIDIDPQYKQAYCNKVISYAKLNNIKEAIDNFSQYIDLDIKYKYSKLRELSEIHYIDSTNEIINMLEKALGEKELEILGDILLNNKIMVDKPINNIKFEDDLCYLISEFLFNATYENKLNKDEKLALLKLILICNKLMHLFIVNEKGKFIHYTKAKNLKLLLKKEKDLKKDEKGKYIFPKMRLNNAVYMNDPEEGKIFNNLLIDSDVKNAINSHNENYTYLACFCPEKEKDKLPMWVHYADGGNGIGIVFNEKFFKDTALYRVQYLDAKNLKKTEIPELEEIVKFLEDDKFKGNKNIIFLELRNIILNYISYLFKDEAYSYEQEVRIIKLRNYNDVKINEDYDVPRLYIDFENDISVDMIDEIIVGPKGNYEEIYAYAKYLGIKEITRSNIKYR